MQAEKMRKGSPTESQMSQYSKLNQSNRRGGMKSRDNKIGGTQGSSKLTTSNSNTAINHMTQTNGLEIKLRQITPSEERKGVLEPNHSRKVTDNSLISNTETSIKPSPTHKIVTRGRADTTATKESSQDEEFKNEYNRSSPF